MAYGRRYHLATYGFTVTNDTRSVLYLVSYCYVSSNSINTLSLAVTIKNLLFVLVQIAPL